MKKLFPLFMILAVMIAGCKEDDPCEGVSCLNDGQCNDGTCVCPTGWSGEFCETSTDSCVGVSCANGGTCVSGTCVCPTGWTGEFCQTSTDPCTGVNCANGGTCVNGTCNCPSGFTGPNCETPVTVDPCDDITCQNGGTCANGICTCPTGWTGTFCQTPVQPTAMKLSKIVLTDWPSSNWDTFSGPDIYMQVLDGSSVVYTSGTCQDCSNSATYTITTPITLQLSTSYTFQIFDYDDTDPDDFMAGASGFFPGNYSATQPSQIPLGTGSMTFTLTVQWVF